MTIKMDYESKFESYAGRTLYEQLEPRLQEFVRQLSFQYHLTFQEFRRVVEASRDLAMWREGDLQTWWMRSESQSEAGRPVTKDVLLASLDLHLGRLRTEPTAYPEAFPKPSRRERKPVRAVRSDKAIFGMCPVASPKTVCCNLRTIDAVENCLFGCSYCAVQTFYTGDIVFDEDFSDKLKALKLERDRFYHIGTGQASDSLAWGNRNGILDDLCEFASTYPNVLLELKTKSANIGYFLSRETPPNVVCSWSLNAPVIIENEEHFTADLDGRLQAARRVADHGVKVAFHFHPMVYYDGWKTDYPALASRLMSAFGSEEVAFISFGSVTLIKPVMRKIRSLGNASKILQTKLVRDPHGKLTYPDEIKISMFRRMYHAFRPWQESVFFYLCMEKRSIWETALGRVYESNDEFEADFGWKTMKKLLSSSPLLRER